MLQESPCPGQPQRLRKTKFGPFESSFEEEPQPLRKVEWYPNLPPFSNNPNDYFKLGDRIPCLSLSRALRKGDILEIKVLSIVDPGSFYIRIIGPKGIMLPTDCEHGNHLSRFTGQVTMFYEKFQNEEFLKMNKQLERGKHYFFNSPYFL